MRIEEMHYDFDIKVDKVDSLTNRNFNAAQKDWLINEAIWVYLKTSYGITNPQRVGFEVTEQRIQDLKNLHIKSPNPQPALTPINLGSGQFEADLSGLRYEHLYVTRLRADISKGNCTKNVNIDTTQTDDLNDALLDPFNKPRFESGDLLGVYGKSNNASTTTNNLYGAGSLFLYTDSTFNVDNVYVDYLKYPNRVWLGTYDLTNDLRTKSVNNTYVYQSGTDGPVHCDLNAHTHNEIIDIAVMLASQLIEDPNLIQLNRFKINTNK
jgi:hypothetical protein